MSNKEPAPRRVALVVFPGVEALDVAGPSAVFAGANRVLAARHPQASPPYDIVLLATSLAPLRTSDGLTLVPDRPLSALRTPVDTLLVAGGPDIETVLDERLLVRGLQRLAGRARRVGSVCTGSFLLAAAGLLDGRRATTHWAYAERFAARFPAVKVDADAIYIRDGEVYTSAGVSAGMDLSMALVEADLGRDVALEVARGLVVYLRRPGGQAQFSGLLAAQAESRSPLAELQLWMAEHLAEDLSIEALATRVAMSPRNFARVFSRTTGVTPARFVERLRIDAARRRLEESDEPIKQVASACGFASVETLRITLHRALGIGPAAYRERFRGMR